MRPEDAVMAARCPEHLVLHRIGGRWTIFIITALADHDGPMRFTQLRDSIDDITPKVLTETLRLLQCDGLVERTSYDERPPRVMYSLTPLGESLDEPLSAMRRWAQLHVPEILAVHENHDDSE